MNPNLRAFNPNPNARCCCGTRVVVADVVADAPVFGLRGRAHRGGFCWRGGRPRDALCVWRWSVVGALFRCSGFFPGFGLQGPTTKVVAEAVRNPMATPGANDSVFTHRPGCPVYSLAWSVRPDRPMRFAIGSFFETSKNKVPAREARGAHAAEAADVRPDERGVVPRGRAGGGADGARCTRSGHDHAAD